MIVVALVFLAMVCAATGFGLWAGHTIGVGDAQATVQYVAAVAKDAYEQGYTDGVAAWIVPASPDRPYDIEADL